MRLFAEILGGQRPRHGSRAVRQGGAEGRPVVFLVKAVGPAADLEAAELGKTETRHLRTARARHLGNMRRVEKGAFRGARGDGQAAARGGHEGDALLAVRVVDGDLVPAGGAQALKVRVVRAGDGTGLAIGQRARDDGQIGIAVHKGDQHFRAGQQGQAQAAVLAHLRLGAPDPAAGVAAGSAGDIKGKGQLVAPVVVGFRPRAGTVARHEGAQYAGNTGTRGRARRAVGDAGLHGGKVVAVVEMFGGVAQGNAQTKGKIGVLPPFVGDFRHQIVAVEVGVIMPVQPEDAARAQHGRGTCAVEDSSPAAQFLRADGRQPRRAGVVVHIFVAQVDIAKTVFVHVGHTGHGPVGVAPVVTAQDDAPGQGRLRQRKAHYGFLPAIAFQP